MSLQLGLWIDHAQAIIVPSNGGEHDVMTIESGAESHHKSFGGRGVTAPGHLHGTSAPHDERRRENELRDFYREVIEACREAEAVLIIGPGTARTELQSHWQELVKGSEPPIAAVEPADKLTPNQLRARVREFFEQWEKTVALAGRADSPAPVRWTKARRPGTRKRRT